MSRKAMKVVVELHLKAVSCPGVHLPAKDDVYVSVCFMSQYCTSLCLPPVFPLLFREKMVFEKVFLFAVDPGDVADMLEYETVKVELVQLTPPVGENLACFREDTRHFLFPEPRLVPCYSGVDREVLMTRSTSFPGIAPRLEFSTRTSIGECSANGQRTRVPRKPHNKSRKSHQGVWSGSGRAPSKPRSRSLSPCKHSRADSCHDNNAGRLAQLTLGSCMDFDKEHSPRNMRGFFPGSDHSPGHSPVMARHTLTNGFTPRSPSSDTDDLLDFPPKPSRRFSQVERSRPNSLVTWEDVQQRVRGLLTTPRAMYRLAHGSTDAEIDDVLARSSISPQRGPL
ncbi:hypothetical protein DPEC_G00102730 [Dallia pectoralis]|uniref:Uncharacterized protein n=1 Tax=Dallia pectoralis TaxID=75939 RepID=A0ACC2GX96_DALPE|nr:hypothetical protein DPEC_G00102730 [Dallia pectoralis]